VIWVRVLVCSRSDAASVTIRDALVSTDAWSVDDATFRSAAVLRRGEARLVEVEGPSVRDEGLSADLRETGWAIDAVWFLSRHRAASGHPSLTVHPIGNHAGNDLGGRERHVSPAAPRDMGALLRRLRVHRDDQGLPHSVTYEATHHGPAMDLPSLFVEIGSDERWYEDPASGRALAAAVTDVLDGGGAPAADAPVLVGVGGGHYVPRHTDVALDAQADFGHFVPAYAVDPEDEDPGALARALEATPGAAGVYVHKKGLKGPQRQRVNAWIDALGVEAWERG